MFDNVEDLERQVQEFQNNILASNKLIEDIRLLTAAVKAQQQSYEQESQEYLKAVNSYVEAIHQESAGIRDSVASDVSSAMGSMDQATQRIELSGSEAIKAFSNNADSVQTSVVANVRAVIGETKDAVNEIKTANESILRAAAERLGEQINANQQQYISQLESTQKSLTVMKDSLNEKYSEFIRQLGNTNVDQLSKATQDMRRSLETKLYLLFAGVGITAILAILALLIK